MWGRRSRMIGPTVRPVPTEDDHYRCERCGVFVSKEYGQGTLCWDIVFPNE